MNQVTAQRRDLQFDSLDEMLAEADRLLAEGYTPRGKWTLGQAASHVADWMRYPVDGFPPTPIWLRPVFWTMRMTVAPGMKRKILKDGFRPGTPTAPASVADRDAMDDAAGVEKLRETVQRVVAYQGELQPSPLFGPMDKDLLLHVTRLHAAHHFGFLEPTAGE